jgi:Sulfotransferase family
MPIFRINDKLHFYAHVPKCGGSSVEFYLTERFGPMALDERGHDLIPPHERWSVESANHMPVQDLYRIFPRDWFVSSFATVRHPLRRLTSAFFFARDVMKRLPLSTDFNAWAATALAELDGAPFRYGSHLLPQTRLVPEDARVFRLEDGLDAIVPYLDGLAGNSDAPRTVPARNVGRWRADESVPTPAPKTLDLVARTYAADFARFGYEPPLSASAVADLPDLPILATTGTAPVAHPRTFARRLHRSLMKRAGM